ncbi:MAG: chorismate-binding protein [Bdellovibrionota bacterium]
MSDLNIKDFLTCGAFLQIGPDLFKIMVGPFTRHSLGEIGHLNDSTLLYSPNFWDFLDTASGTPQKPVYSSAKSYTFDREEFIYLLSKIEAKRPDITWQVPNETQFRTQFDWSQQNFIEQKLSKTVPIIRQHGEVLFLSENLLWCMQNLLQNKNFGWSYGFFDNSSGMIGHTPEVLAQWTKTDRQLHTVALAGTYTKADEAYEKILHDKKIQNEHQIVIDDIVDKLSALNFKSKAIQGETDVLELRYLLHLMTEFQIEIDSVEQAFEVINILHPTSAMGLYPYDAAKLKEFSQFSLQKERMSFAAPFAIVEKDAVYCVVAIRNMTFAKDKVQVFSGCGVTPESKYELELTESQNKRDSVKKMLGLNLD